MACIAPRVQYTHTPRATLLVACLNHAGVSFRTFGAGRSPTAFFTETYGFCTIGKSAAQVHVAALTEHTASTSSWPSAEAQPLADKLRIARKGGKRGPIVLARLGVGAYAGSGLAKVTLSVPDWKERPVAPASFEIPIRDIPPKLEAPKLEAPKH